MKKLNGRLDGRCIYVNGDRIRVGSVGSATAAEILFCLVGKSRARKIRKILRANGESKLAAMPRMPIPF